MPKFSIIIPVYNGAQYLRACLDSVLTQTLSSIDRGETIAYDFKQIAAMRAESMKWLAKTLKG